LLSFRVESFVLQFGIQKHKDKINRTIILAAVWCEYETWSLILREKRRLRLYENRVLRRIFGPNRNEITGVWRKLYKEALNDLYSSTNVIRVIKSRRMVWAEHVARMGERRDVYGVVVRKPEGRRPLGRAKCTWEDNIKLDLQEVGFGGTD